MVQVIQPRDIGGEMGQAIGGGLGGGFGEAMKMLTQKKVINDGINQVQAEMQEKRDAGEKINPTNSLMNLYKALAHTPGGMQAVSDLAPSFMKEINRQNLSTPAPQKANEMPEGSIIEDQENPKGAVKVESPEEEGDNLVNLDEYYDKKFQENLDRSQDVDLATKMTNAQVAAKSAEQGFRIQEYNAAKKNFDEKIEENFPNGISAPFKNEFSKQYFDAVKTSDPTRAWNKVYPKFRNAQLAEERLKGATAATRPVLFNGDISNRMEAARVELKDISDIDPEYAISLAQNDLNYGPSEAAEIVRPGSDKFKKFVSQVRLAPSLDTKDQLSRNFSSRQDKFLDSTENNLVNFFKNGWDKDKDSLIALRGQLFDKGFPEDRFISAVGKAFPDKNKDSRLSTLNQNEYSKLGEPIIPGLQEIFSQMFTGKFMEKAKKTLKYPIQGKR